MVLKIGKWTPLPPPPATRKFLVKLRSFRLEGIENIFEWKTDVRTTVSLKVKWKGEPRKFGLHHLIASKQHRREDSSREIILEKGQNCLTWDDDEFENVCCFTTASSSHDENRHNQFAPWHISFRVLLGDYSKGKMVGIGRGRVNVSEMAARMESDIQYRAPISLRVAGIPKMASLLVNFTVVDMRDSPVSTRTGHDWTESTKRPHKMERVQQPGQEHVGVDKPETSSATGSDSSSAELDRDKKAVGWFSWKRRRPSSRTIWYKEEPLIKKTRSWNFGSIVDLDINQHNKVGESEPSLESNGGENQTTGAWESKELISRDGQTKLKSDVFFASFDQRSDKAAGESACTALVAVISHWLHSNSDRTPAGPEFDDLIVQGSSEWRKLCQNAHYLENFPNKHFDLETVIHAGIRPVAISRDESFVGFFNPDKFESLSGVMSFDQVWEKIVTFSDDHRPRIYIISWNDHFFVLKVDRDAYYIIDTLGERLYEGCENAYALRFDDKSLMLRKIKGDRNEDEKIICTGKECCKEFIVRFLAAIPLEELEEEEKKEAVSYFSLHHRLQIEFNLTYMLSSLPSSSSSSLISSPFSSSASTPSRL